MGYLNNATTVLDAILTKKGRELLARGQNAFNITKFALSDDEVDYGLWDVSHPNGTDYYGQVIENLPLLEPTPDPDTIMKYKLVTRNVGTNKMSQIDGIQTGYTVQWSSLGHSAASITISPSTTNLPTTGDTKDPAGYSFTILNSSICYLTSGGGSGGGSYDYSTDTQNVSQTVTGADVILKAKAVSKPATGEPNPTTALIVTGLSYGSTYAATITISYLDES